ncbi:MAG: hypothetical protein NC192_03530 [Muribaculaceae bacterium]|nr:hypothetical protein [Muribaculaceae bacterium]
MDFNTKKNILRKLAKKRAENKLMWLPCVIAAAFVKLWYGAVCGIGMAFSDRNGNFLGIKRERKSPAAKKVRRQDDIVYVKKPFIGRVLSGVLAAAFVLMVAPELEIDLGITASAEMQTGIPAVDGDGNSLYFVRDSSTDNIVYLEDDWEHATQCYSTEVTSFDVAYGSFRLAWQPVMTNSCGNSIDHTLNMEMIYGYRVNIFSNDNSINITKEYVSTQTEDVFTVPNFTSQLAAKSVTAAITPLVKVEKWDYTAADPTIPDSTATVQRLNREYTNFDGQTTRQLIGTLDARFNPPTINLPVSKNSDSYTTSVELKWAEAVQIGGQDGGTATASGYNIYRRRENGNYERIASVINGTEYTDDSLLNGYRYEYFIEAYRSVWGDTAYDPNNAGLITSNGITSLGTGIDDSNVSDIAQTIYTNQKKFVYVAPDEPNLVVTSSPGKNSIELRWGPNSGDYSGVRIYRTTGEDSELDPNDPALSAVIGSKRFSDWLYDTAKSKTNPYGLVEIAQLGKNENTLDDKNIIEGQTYWYYAVAYLNEGDGKWLYGSAARNSSKLNLTLNRPIGLTAENRDGQVNLTWEAVTGAQGYEIEIVQTAGYNEPSDQFAVTIYENYDNYNKTNFLHNYLYNTDGYTYRVRAYINIQSVDEDGKLQTKKYSEWSQPTRMSSVGLPMAIPQNVAADGSVDGQITVTWEAVQGATSYTVYYENMNSSSDKGQIDGLTGTRYVHTNLENGERYSYYIVAHKEIKGDGSKGTQLVDSTPSGVAKAKVGTGLTTPQDLLVTTVDGQVNVSWSAVPGAQGYLLYYKKNEESFNENNVFDLAKTSFTHTRLKNGDTYTYYVIAYKEVSGARDYSPKSLEVSTLVGDVLDAPKDFTVTTADGTVNMTWTAVKGAEGYIVHASSGGRYYQFDVSRVNYTHTDLTNGDVWTYYVTAYKTVNGTRTYSNASESKSVTIGTSLNSAVDLTATAGNRQIDLTWTAVNGADGYVVYLYNSSTMEFEPITVTSKTTYSHVGLKNGKQYTYMVAPYKNINGKRFYGDYSISVTAIPTTGSITDMDHELIVKGTAPYGISHSEYITAVSNHGAFDESVDVYFSTSREATQEVRDVLQNYADGLSSFIVYPFDISIYRENTYIEVDPEDGYIVTVTMPVPDRLIAYRDYITVVHIGDGVAQPEEISLAEDWYNNYDQRLEVLPCAIVDIDNVWCVQFKCSSFSPYALVIYKEHIQDIAAGGGLMDTGFADTFNSGVLLFTALPDIMPNNRKLRIVQSGSKRYRIKSVTKR